MSASDRRSAFPPLLTLEDVALLLGLANDRAARRLIQTQGIPHTRLGRRIFVVLEDLVRFVQNRASTDDRGARLQGAISSLDGARATAKGQAISRLPSKR